MNKLSVPEITKLFEENRIHLFSEIRQIPHLSDAHFVFVSVFKNKDGKQQPTKKLLNEVAQKVSSKGGRIEYVLRDENLQELENAVRATLVVGFPNEIRNVFLSGIEGKLSIWVETLSSPDAETEKAIMSRVNIYSEMLGFAIGGLYFTSRSGLPTEFEVLKLLRIVAPAKPETIGEKLASSSRDPIPTKFINNRLDRLRRKGLVLRTENEEFVLTTKALAILGTQKGRSSPDIKRFLDLARRGA